MYSKCTKSRNYLISKKITNWNNLIGMKNIIFILHVELDFQYPLLIINTKTTFTNYNPT